MPIPHSMHIGKSGGTNTGAGKSRFTGVGPHCQLCLHLTYNLAWLAKCGDLIDSLIAGAKKFGSDG